MVTPAVFGLVLFVAAPFVVAVVLSFFNVQLNSVHAPKFFGMTQYVRLFSDPIVSGPFLQALGNNRLFRIQSVVRAAACEFWGREAGSA